jgi:anti-anti-sigma factor
MTVQLTIEVERRREKSYVMMLSGRLDSNSYPFLEDQIALLLAGPVEVLTIDLEGLTYISSMGLRAIFRAREAVKAQHGNLVLTRLQPQVMKVFEIAHSLRHVPIFDNIEEADRFFDVVQEMATAKDEPAGGAP